MEGQSSFCIDCCATVSAFQEAIQCDTCHLWQHRECNSGINKEDYRKAVSGEIELSWNCAQCSWGPNASNGEESIVSSIENSRHSGSPAELKFKGNYSQTSNIGKRYSASMEDNGAGSMKFNQPKKFKQEFLNPTATYGNVNSNNEASFSGSSNKLASADIKLKSYVCHLCDNEFRGVKALIAHVSEDHSEDSPPKVKTEAVSPVKQAAVAIKNSTIKKTISTLKKENLPVNLPDTEQGELLKNKLFTCGVCDLVFLRQDILMDHLKVHTNILPITCHLCNEVFCSKHERKSLKLLNPKGALYHCNLCNKNFSRKDSLRKHLRTHTGERPYSCEICMKTFTRRDCRAVHMKIHFKVKSYPCELCGESFACRQPLIDHIKSHIIDVDDLS